MLCSMSGSSHSPSASVFGESFCVVPCHVKPHQILLECSVPGVPGASLWSFGAKGYPSHSCLGDPFVLHSEDVAGQSESSYML